MFIMYSAMLELNPSTYNLCLHIICGVKAIGVPEIKRKYSRTKLNDFFKDFNSNFTSHSPCKHLD